MEHPIQDYTLERPQVPASGPTGNSVSIPHKVSSPEELSLEHTNAAIKENKKNILPKCLDQEGYQNRDTNSGQYYNQRP